MKQKEAGEKGEKTREILGSVEGRGDETHEGEENDAK